MLSTVVDVVIFLDHSSTTIAKDLAYIAIITTHSSSSVADVQQVSICIHERILTLIGNVDQVGREVGAPTNTQIMLTLGVLTIHPIST